MNAIELKRAEFRHYLEKSGVMDALSYALIKLYDEEIKPENPIAFVRKNFKKLDDDEIDDFVENRVGDLEAPEFIHKLQDQLEKARSEISSLRNTLQTMNMNVDGLDGNEERKFRTFIDDPKNKTKLITKFLTIEAIHKACELKAKPLIMECIEESLSLCSPSIGIAAAKPECYNSLAIIFEPLIEEIHSVANDVKQPNCCWGDWKEFENLDNAFVQSIRISCRRSIANFPFSIEMSEQDFENVLNAAQNAIQKVFVDDMNGIDGEFYKICDVNENEPIFDDLKKNRIGYSKMDEKSQHNWPVGRGLFVNGNRTLSILINENDHLHFISCQNSGDFSTTYENIVTAIRKINNEIEFVCHDKFGWLTMCPSNIGTTIHCEVQINIDSNDVSKLNEICDKFQLNHHVISDNIVEISNKRRFGLSEFDCVKTVYYGVKEINRLFNNDSNDGIIENERKNGDKPDENIFEAENSEIDEKKDDPDTEKILKEKESAEEQMNSIQSNGTYTKESADIDDTKIDEIEDKIGNEPQIEEKSEIKTVEIEECKPENEQEIEQDKE